ncbi:pore-forming ESAT-6 family protein [Kribbella sp. NPDC051586]|uniref:pore-forming ESAT-6 family protein n=1 Tax=Kribbella sp. NPDC051586 TaxID=3364118 RepID=UPI0037978D10
MANRNSYDTAASGEVQATIKRLSGQIEALIAAHRKNVQAALADASATGVTDSYRAVEDRFNKAADSTLGIIGTLRETMQANDNTARATLKKAQSAVDNIGG